MRWSDTRPTCGQKSVKKTFLLFPKCLDREWRWLEYTGIVQSFGIHFWHDEGWAPEPYDPL